MIFVDDRYWNRGIQWLELTSVGFDCVTTYLLEAKVNEKGSC